nr:hypothetical protein [uncultured Blautia sp.]
MIEIIDTKQSEVTDQEVAEAVNTIRKYCDGRFCNDCAIRKVCEEYFDSHDDYPDDWPEMEVPDD